MRFKALAFVGALLLGGSEMVAAPLLEPCTRWSDVATGLVFPKRMGGLEMSHRTVYGEEVYGLRWDSDDSRAVRAGGTHLDFYVYAREKKNADDQGVADELHCAEEAVRDAVAKGALFDLEIPYESRKGALTKSGLSYRWRGFSVRFEKEGEKHLSAILVTAFRGRFLKLRYSVTVPESCLPADGEFPPQFILMVGELDNMVKAAQLARERDIYAIDDPHAAFEALRAKHAGVEMRVGAWDMPEHVERFQELCRAQDWCIDKIDERCETLERVMRTAVRARIQPELFYYNLACALALQGKKEDAFTALEQAVAAGCEDAAHTKKDADLKPLRADPRFPKLLRLMETREATAASRRFKEPRKGREIALSDESVEYDLDMRAYEAFVSDMGLSRPGEFPVVYSDRGNGAHDKIMEENPSFVELTYPEAARRKGRDAGPANTYVYDVAGKCYAPVFAVCGRTRKTSPLGATTGWGSALVQRDVLVPVVPLALCGNVLGLYAADDDYGRDGIDRHVGWGPTELEYAGDDAAPFVRAANAALQNMDRKLRAQAIKEARLPQVLVMLVRGDAWRPVLTPADLDFAAITNRARALAALPPPIPCLAQAAFVGRTTPMTNLWTPPFDHPHQIEGVVTHAFIHSWAERTGTYEIEVHASSERVRPEWKVLQGDPGKVRIRSLSATGTVHRVQIEVDWHDVFDVALPDGRKLKSSRVDVGCFAVDGGHRSVPAVFSVYFSPNATRVYDDKERLASVDYTRPQLDAYRPRLCARGDWRDEFHWTEGGELSGWTRVRTDRNGAEARTEFTREGLVVRTKDRLGRPLDVRRDLRATWFQRTRSDARDEELEHELVRQGIEQDDVEEPGDVATLLWRYVYTNDVDRFGKPTPSSPQPYRHRPELCRRADFAATNTGFRLSIYRQMMLGELRYTGFKYGIDDSVEDLQRSDGPFALAEKGLKPPETLQKMSFCPWAPSSNDVWKIEGHMLRHADAWTKSMRLMELGDGSYRLQVEEREWASLRNTHQGMNAFFERLAYEALDGAYPRCSAEVCERVFRGVLGAEGWRACKVLEKGWNDEPPERAGAVFSAWRISSRMYLGAYCDWQSGFHARRYLFARTPTDAPGEAVACHEFDAPPSLAEGNAVLLAAAGNPEAQNNLGVLIYAGVVNPTEYEESAVAKLLMSAAKQGNVTAMRNLAVLYMNRGEPKRAERFLEAARLKEEADREAAR